MPTITVEIEHSIGKDKAQRKIKELAFSAANNSKFNISDLQITWGNTENKFRFRVNGFQVSGSLLIKEESVVVHGSIPIAFMIFKNQIRKTIKEQGKRLLQH